MRNKYLLALLCCFFCLPCLYAQNEPANLRFWNNLQQYCGKSFTGEVTQTPTGDTVFLNKNLLMHIHFCTPDSMRISFIVADNRSRTWVLTRRNEMIKLKHDHRHEDGTPDRITQYGGTATNYGTETRQIFPADAYTAALIATGAANVWWIDLVPGEHFTYNLVRLGTDRKYSIKFDLRRAVSENPPPPWGEKEK